jgi:hypothetical protein
MHGFVVLQPGPQFGKPVKESRVNRPEPAVRQGIGDRLGITQKVLERHRPAKDESGRFGEILDAERNAVRRQLELIPLAGLCGVDVETKLSNVLFCDHRSWARCPLLVDKAIERTGRYLSW